MKKVSPIRNPDTICPLPMAGIVDKWAEMKVEFGPFQWLHMINDTQETSSYLCSIVHVFIAISGLIYEILMLKISGSHFSPSM